MKNLKLSSKAQSLKPGLYKHTKTGNKYKVLGVGFNSETLEECVIYQAQYGEKFISIRPLTMFLETVEIEGVLQPRFQYIGL